ncbi:AGR324Cp [Eremothecium gossypii ATCC 10895]|uniref:Xylulose kinase n=1 Tax=Eremothecium gossypii (strain ATCC 10895 / CBS 109.51 / FGSC 9923 / NRRL Y-1056) TaxID=284811 RepID=Q74Z82_EREGS|nr:AGR324Cp [Eremothecium gossypii ATCC 10895]AAS54814.2 AGR324Cp [Eremothecium gossypii ATCC 10895]AEY99146.1 FAGR324Cp [Eremothecium gossypii FDAG1]
MAESKLYLGFDLSTQQLKCLAIDEDLAIKCTAVVDFDRDLAGYETVKGVYTREDNVVESPVEMWLEALDLCFERLAREVDLGAVEAISGSCQQHASVYWTEDVKTRIRELDSRSGLRAQLGPCLSRANAPNWQDHSTEAQREQFEAHCGGPQELAQLTGSKAHFRFTGLQIKKIRDTEPATFAATAAISLASSFLASVLVGKLVPPEEADACGMNLYDIAQHRYDEGLLQMVDDALFDKLCGNPVRCDNVRPLGTVSRYFKEKYGINTSCNIYQLTGDNLATICSLPLQKNDLLVSLGTSTTVLAVTEKYSPSPNYHMFIHPTIPGNYMGMVCYCNGALARERIKDTLGDESGWAAFSKALEDDSVDTSAELGVYFPLPEIVPSVDHPLVKRVRISPKGLQEVESFASPAHDAKNIVESQALSCRVRVAPLLSTPPEISDTGGHAAFDGQQRDVAEFTRRPNRVFFVGGASKNDAIVRAMADILGAKGGNYRLETSNSCALGGCYKAFWSDLLYKQKTNASFADWLDSVFKWDRDCKMLCKTDNRKWAASLGKIAALSRLEETL